MGAKNKKIIVAAAVDAALHAVLLKMAQTQYTTISSVVRQALAQFVKKEKP